MHHRWGFRQVAEKSSPSVPKFTHLHFKRGDKQLCLLMRSIVNKSVALTIRQSLQQVAPPRPQEAVVTEASSPCSHLTNNALQAFSFNTLGQYGLVDMAQGAILPPPLFLYRDDLPAWKASDHGTITSSSPLWPPSFFTSAPDRFSQLSAAVSLEAGQHHLEKALLLNPALSGEATAVGSHGLSSGNRNFGMLHGNMNFAGEDVPVVAVVASQIMKGNPSIEPWSALELAKKILARPPSLNGTSLPNRL